MVESIEPLSKPSQSSVPAVLQRPEASDDDEASTSASIAASGPVLTKAPSVPLAAASSTPPLVGTLASSTGDEPLPPVVGMGELLTEPEVPL
jgi:hypothetical protein